MTDRELMQESLIALRSCSGAPHWPALQPIVTALRERLAQLDFEMQPCAGRNCGSTNPNLHSAECFEDYEKSTGMATQPVAVVADHPERIDWLRNEPPDGTLLYTAPPQRQPWVGLTGDEVNEFAAGCHLGNSVQGAIRKAEAKLKEKNT